jgi:hypothetical protein
MGWTAKLVSTPEDQVARNGAGTCGLVDAYQLAGNTPSRGVAGRSIMSP